MGGEEARLSLGMTGWWQVQTFTMVALLVTLPSYSMIYTSTLVWFAGHSYHCAAKDNISLEDSIPGVFNSQNRELVYSKCDQFQTSRNESNVTEPCTRWEVDPEPFLWTAVMEWSLLCEKGSYVEVAQLVFRVGNIGYFLIAPFADWYGRRPTLFLLQLIQSLFGIAAAFATSPYILSGLQLCIGIIGSGNSLCGYVSLGEIFPLDVRVYTAAFIDVFVNIAVMVWVLPLFLIRDLRLLQLVISCLSLLVLPFYFWCPESVRWLAANKRYDEAQNVLDKAARVNRLPPIPRDLLLSETTPSQRTTVEDRPTMLKFIRNPRSLKYCCCLGFILIVEGYVQAALSTLVQLLPGNIFLNYLVYALLAIAGAFIAMASVHCVGRRYAKILFLMCCVVFLGTAAGFSARPVKNVSMATNNNLVTTFVLLANICLTAAYVVQTLFLYDIFPTLIRTTGIGIMIGLSTFGYAISPALSLFLNRRYSLAAALGIMAVLLLLGAVCTVHLPEGLGRPLPETIQEVLDMPRTLSQEDRGSIKRDQKELWRQIKHGLMQNRPRDKTRHRPHDRPHEPMPVDNPGFEIISQKPADETISSRL